MDWNWTNSFFQFGKSMVKCWLSQEKFQYRIVRSPNGGSLVPHTLLNTSGYFYFFLTEGGWKGEHDGGGRLSLLFYH